MSTLFWRIEEQMERLRPFVGKKVEEIDFPPNGGLTTGAAALSGT